MKSRSAKASEPAAVELIEEAVHLLRSHPSELGWYYAGTGLFAVGFLYFWAFVTWFVPPDGAIALGALGLVFLYGAMLAAQHRFAVGLRARLVGDQRPRWTAARWRTEIAAQLRLHALSLIILPLAAVFTVPFGWAWAYFQSAIVTPASEPADTATRRAAAWRLALLWPGQNHRALAIFAALWFMLFLNVASAFYTVPALISRWLGLETIFALQGWQVLSVTYLALVGTLTQLLIGPLIRAFYVLRVFRGESRTTGEDIRLVLRREQSTRARQNVAAGILVAVALWFAGANELRATEAAANNTAAVAGPVLETEALDARIDQVLAQRDYRWRLKPAPLPPERENEGIVKGLVRSTFSVVREIISTVRGWYQQAEDWVRDVFSGEKKEQTAARPDRPQRDGSVDWMYGLQLVAYALLVIIAGLLIFVAWKVWRHRREFAVPVSGGGALSAAVPDLRDESVEASRLPAHEWIELARAQLAAGEWRLALRALFLATLATHAHEGLLSLAKFKTNLDYERELRRRAHGRAELIEEFRARRREFESVWYGAEPAREETALGWLQRLEGRS